MSRGMVYYGLPGRAPSCALLAALLTLAGALLPALGAVPPDPAGWQVLYQEAFTNGDAGWMTWGPNVGAPVWEVEEDAGNAVYSGTSNAYTNAHAGPWTDFRFHWRAKILNGTLMTYFRRGACTFYGFSINEGAVALFRTTTNCGEPTMQQNVLVVPQPPSMGVWHTMDLLAQGGCVRLFIDGSLSLEYNDPAPLLVGKIGFGALDNSHVHVDDVTVTGPVSAQTLHWTRTGGPLGGVGYDIRMRPGAPDTMLVTDAFSGVSRSTDGGIHWTPSNQGILTRSGHSGDSVPVFCLTIDPNQPDVVWAGTQNTRGIYKSTDGGRTWVQKDHGVVERSGLTFRGFTVDPHNSLVVYAAGEISSTIWAGQYRMGRMFDMVKGVVYKTTDGGENWRAVWRGDNLARYVWIDPRDSKVLYVSTGIFDREAANSDPVSGAPGGVGILKSTDGGESWTVLNQANGLANLYVGSLYMNPANPDILLAGTGHAVYGQYQDVYLSTDAGQTWRRTLLVALPGVQGNGDQISAVEYSTLNPQIAYAAGGHVHRSEDGGLTWRRMTTAPAPPGHRVGIALDLQVDPRNPDRVFINNYTGGNVLSEDGGRTWSLASQGYTGANMHDIAADPADPRRVYAMGQNGAFRSDDGGGNWIGLNYPAANYGTWYPNGGAISSDFYAAAPDPGHSAGCSSATRCPAPCWRVPITA